MKYLDICQSPTGLKIQTANMHIKLGHSCQKLSNIHGMYEVQQGREENNTLLSNNVEAPVVAKMLPAYDEFTLCV